MVRTKPLFIHALAGTLAAVTTVAVAAEVEVGPRPFFLVNLLEDGELKDKLAACEGPFQASKFSIGHRGAPLQFPEHTRESYVAGAKMGAGILECDVTFTKDHELVCRHAQCDLHTTTNILATDLAAKCSQPFTPASGDEDASAKCCASDLTLAEFRTLHGKMDASNPKATTAEEFMGGTADYRTDLYSPGTLITHAESIELFKSLGTGFTPELKSPDVEMPHDGFSQEDYAQKLIDEYKAAGIDPSEVWAQSFNLDDVKYWIANEPAFGEQAVYLDDRYETLDGFDPNDPATFRPTMEEIAADGVKIIAPPLWMLLTVEDGKVVPNAYADAAKSAGLGIITWTLERSGPLSGGGGWYYQSVADVTNDDGDMLTVLDVLAQDVGVIGVFSDWPATTTFYANCMGL